MKRINLALYLALLSMFMALPIGCGGISKVGKNLDDQRELYGLERVDGDTCAEVVTGFEGYEDLVITPVPADDPAWEILTASECKTFRAHVDAYNAYCGDELPYFPNETTVDTCAALNSWR